MNLATKNYILGLLSACSLLFLNSTVYAEDYYNKKERVYSKNPWVDEYYVQEKKYNSKTEGYSHVKNNVKNSTISNGKTISTNKIEYIKENIYNGESWLDYANYRVYGKDVSPDMSLLNAYTIFSLNPERMFVLTLQKVTKGGLEQGPEHRGNLTLKKGDVYIQPYFLYCNKEIHKNNKLKNKYVLYYFDGVLGNMSPLNMTEEPSTKKQLDLICKHTYIDRTNGLLDILPR